MSYSYACGASIHPSHNLFRLLSKPYSSTNEYKFNHRHLWIAGRDVNENQNANQEGQSEYGKELMGYRCVGISVVLFQRYPYSPLMPPLGSQR